MSELEKYQQQLQALEQDLEQDVQKAESNPVVAFFTKVDLKTAKLVEVRRMLKAESLEQLADTAAYLLRREDKALSGFFSKRMRKICEDILAKSNQAKEQPIRRTQSMPT